MRTRQQGIVCRGLRTRVAIGVLRSGSDPFYAIIAPVAVGAIWTVPAVVVGAIAWRAWQVVPATVDEMAGWYLDRLHLFAFGIDAL